MRKSASRVLHKLQLKKLRFIYLALLILLASGIIFALSLSINTENARNTAVKINEKCRGDNFDRCLKDFFTQYALKHKFSDSKQVLDYLQVINPSVKYCHPFAHVISIVEVKKNPDNWLNIFSYIPDSECSYGYFHGVIEGLYRSKPKFSIDSGFIETVCLKDIGKNNFARSCAHAFGHVVLTQESGKVEKGLEICEKLQTKLKDACFQGVFMENIQRENLSVNAISEREFWDINYLNKEIEYCNRFTGSKQNECWRSLSPVLRMVFNTEEAVKVCQTGPEYFSRRFCIREVVGSELVAQFSQERRDKALKDECLMLRDTMEEYANCLTDAINYVLLTSVSFEKDLVGYCEVVLPEIKNECIIKIEDF